MITLKAIIPKPLKEAKMRLELLNEIRKAGTAVRKDFAKTTETWQNKPTFKEQISLKGGTPSLTVWTEHYIYQWITNGTRGGYEIWAGIYTGRSDKKALTLPSTFSPKTVPGTLTATAGFTGGPVVLRRSVIHPGIEPRKFDEMIKEMWEDEFLKRMEEAMKRAAEKSGHAE